MKKTKRISFDFSCEVYDHLSEMTRLTGHTSKADVVRNAILLYSAWAKRTSEGWSILYQKGEDKFLVEIVF